MKKINFGIIQFPGSNCEQDCFHVISNVIKQNCRYIWHDSKSLRGIDCVIVPGGFSYGDYLRTGAIAAQSKISYESYSICACIFNYLYDHFFY